jgi:hypothetical protein
LLRDRILPEPVGEKERPVWIPEGTAHAHAMILSRSRDPQGSTGHSPRVGGDRQQIEPNAVPVPQLEIGMELQRGPLQAPEALLSKIFFSVDRPGFGS